jgi:hypothetical protein
LIRLYDIRGPDVGRENPRVGVDAEAMRKRAFLFFGALAAVVLLVGIAFGAFSRRNVPPPSAEAASPPS